MASHGLRASRHTSLSPTAPSCRSKWRITPLISPSSLHSLTALSRARRFGTSHPYKRLRSRILRVAPLHSFRGVPLFRHQSYLPLRRTRHQAVFPLSGGYHRVHERSEYRLPHRSLWKVVSPPVTPPCLRTRSSFIPPCPRTRSFLPTPSYKRLGVEVVASLMHRHFLMHRHLLRHRHILVHRHQSHQALCPCTLKPPSPFLLLLSLLLVTTCTLSHRHRTDPNRLRPSTLQSLSERRTALQGRGRWRRRRKDRQRSRQVPQAAAQGQQEQEQPAQQSLQSPALAGRRRSPPLELRLVLALPTILHLLVNR